MATVTLNWTNPTAGNGGTPQGYYIYRGNGDIEPGIQNGAFTNMSKVGQPKDHNGAGASNQTTDTSAESGREYTYCIVAYNEAGEGITSGILHDTVTA